jgi:hypothetical protein
MARVETPTPSCTPSPVMPVVSSRPWSPTTSIENVLNGLTADGLTADGLTVDPQGQFQATRSL